MTGAIISQRGCANPRRGGPTYCWPKSVENYMKMKKNWMKGGLHPKHPNPPTKKIVDPPLITVLWLKTT